MCETPFQAVLEQLLLLAFRMMNGNFYDVFVVKYALC